MAHLIELGFSPVEIAERLGHESMAVTMTYSHLYPSKGRTMADRLGEDRDAHTTPKKKDEKRRKRNVIMNFRVSPEEKERIEERIALSGLMKSEYFINSCLDNKVMAYGNVRTFEKIKQSLIDIEEHLSRIERTDELDPVVMEQLLMILELYQGLEK